MSVTHTVRVVGVLGDLYLECSCDDWSFRLGSDPFFWEFEEAVAEHEHAVAKAAAARREGGS